MDITRDWVSSFVVLSQAFTAADFSCWLFVGLSAFSFVFSKWNAGRRLTWSLQNIPLFYLQKLLGCFCCMFWVIVHLYYEAPSNQLWIWAESISLYTSEFIRLLLSSVMSSLNNSNLVLHHVHRWCCMLWIMSCSKPSPYFFLPVILVQVDLNFSHPKNAFSEVVWLF